MASEGTIDRIAISISADADAAVKSINKLSTSLKNLQSASSSIQSLRNLSSALKKLTSATKGLDTSALSKIKVSATAGKNLQSLATSLNQIPSHASSRLKEVAKGMDAVANTKTITSAKIKGLTQLAPALQQLESANMASLVSQFNQLSSALTRLAPQIQTLGASSSQFASSMRSVASSGKSMATATGKVKTATGEATTSTSKWKNSMGALKTVMTQLSPMSLINRITMFKVAIAGVVNVLGKFVNASNSYIENQNLFQAAMGATTQSASEFGLKAQSLLGIDFNDWMRNQGVFQTLATGMGVTSDKADIMSQQLTQLGYDISSFYNISVDEAMLKLQSGLAGELEPLRRIGWDLSVARMNAELAAKGFDMNANSMSQAEKVALRYEMIMSQVTITHGDMARTIMAPANSIRVFQAQMQVAARAIGNLFIPLLSALIPVAIGVVKAFTWAAQAIAKLFNIDANFEIDYSSLDTSGIATSFDDTSETATDAADSVGDVADATAKATKKAKEYKNTVMGFDELNKLNDVTEDTTDSTPSSGSSGGTGGTAATPSVGDIAGLPTYDFFEGLATDFGKLTDEWGKHAESVLKGLIPVIVGVGAAFKAWSIANALKELGYFKNLTGKELLKKVAGIGIAFTGLTAIIINAVDAWTNGLDYGNFIGLVGGVALAIGGLGLAFGTVGAAIAGVIGGIVMVVVGLHDAFENGFNTCNGLMIAFGGAIAAVSAGCVASLAAIGLGATAIAGPIGLAVAAIVALGVGVAAAVVWGMQDCCKSVDALGDVSEETRERFGTSVTSIEDMQKSLKEHQFGQDVIDENDIAWVQEKTQDIHNTIMNNLDAKRNEELANIDSLSGLMSDERIQEIKDKTNQYYDEQAAAEEAGNAEILQIYQRAAEEKRSLSSQEIERLTQLQNEQKDRLVNVTAETQEEINSINQKMAQNNEAEALQSAEKVLQNAISDRDNTIQAAKDKYDGIVAQAGKLKDAGSITDEEYDAMVKAAESQRDSTINAAYETWDRVKRDTENGLGESKGKINTETGEIKSNWNIFTEDLQKGWDEFWGGVGQGLDDFGNNFNNACNDMGSNIQTAFNDAGASIETWWGDVGSWFDENVGQPLGSTFDNTKGNIETAFSTGKSVMEELWKNVKDWFWDNVASPVIEKFNSIKDGIGGAFKSAWDTVTNIWNGIGSFFDGIKNTVVNAFWGIYNKAWDIFNGIKTFIGNIFNTIVNFVKTPINTIIGAINNISIDVPDWVPGIGGKHFGFNIPYLASGGLLNTGQLFVAREAGPEMVGTIGGQTAVANNEQIIAGIQQGVTKAILNVAPVFNNNNNEETTVILRVGNEDLAKAVAKGNQKLTNRGFVNFA